MVRKGGCERRLLFVYSGGGWRGGGSRLETSQRSPCWGGSLVMLTLVVVVAGCNAAADRESDDGCGMAASADALLDEFLGIRNSRDGIAFVGGPFKRADYVRSEESPTASDEVTVHYRYKRPLGVAGAPDTVRISVSRGWYVPMADYPASECCGSEFLSGLTAGQQQARMPVPRHYPIQGPEDVPVEVVEMVRKAGWQVTRTRPRSVNVCKCEHVGSDICVVYFGRTCADFHVFDYYADWTLDRATFRPLYDEGKPITGGVELSRQQRFLIYRWNGCVSDEELITLIPVLERIAPSPVISAVIAHEGSLRLSFGQGRSDFPFGSVAHAEPMARVVYRMREGTWELLELAMIERVVPDYGSSPPTLLFRPEVEVSRDVVDKYLLTNEWREGLADANLTDQDLCEIYRIAVRCRLFPCFQWVTVEIRDPAGVYVWPQSYSDFVGRALYLYKAENKWVVDWDRPP